MPANFTTGYTVREPAWHRQGVVLEEAPENWEAARATLGTDGQPILGWEPERHPVYAFSGLTPEGEWTSNPADADPDLGEFSEVTEYSRILRSDTRELLAVTTSSREVITHQDMGEAITAILGETGMSIDTMGVLEGGKKVYATLFLDEPLEVIGRFAKDPSLTQPFITATNSHDVGSFRLGFNEYRVLCGNTFQGSEMAQEARGYGYYSFRHTANWKEQVEAAQEAIAGLRSYRGDYQDAMNGLADMQVNLAQTEEYISRFVSLPEFGATSRVERNAARARQAIRDLLEGPTCEGIKGSAYGLVMASTEMLDHLRGTRGNRNDSIVKRQIIMPNTAKTKAVILAREVASSIA